jgi:sugar lactone lactonase YvrE
VRAEILTRVGGRLLDGVLAVEVERDRPRNRANDAKCDPAGRLWLGTMEDEAAEGAAALYRIDPDRTCRLHTPALTIGNGTGWSADATRMFHVDSPTGRVDVLDYDVATGAATARRVFADLGAHDGIPDGLAVDAEDGLWVAMHEGGCVLRLAADGTVAGRVEVPVPRPTSCAFAGDDLDVLVITTAGDGDLYACTPGVRGLPVAPFAG